MDITGLIVFLAIGAVAGWLGSTIMKGGGFGLIGNIVVGIVGAVIGGYIFGLLGISAGGLIGSVVTATVGAIVLLFIVGLVKKAWSVMDAASEKKAPSHFLGDHAVRSIQGRE